MSVTYPFSLIFSEFFGLLILRPSGMMVTVDSKIFIATKILQRFTVMLISVDLFMGLKTIIIDLMYLSISYLIMIVEGQTPISNIANHLNLIVEL